MESVITKERDGIIFFFGSGGQDRIEFIKAEIGLLKSITDNQDRIEPLREKIRRLIEQRRKALEFFLGKKVKVASISNWRIRGVVKNITPRYLELELGGGIFIPIAMEFIEEVRSAN